MSARKIYKLEEENDMLKRYIQFLEAKCKEYEKHYNVEIQIRNSLPPMPRIITDETNFYDTQIIRIPERKFLVGCQDLSKIEKEIHKIWDGINE